MKVVIFNFCDKNEFNREMEIINKCGTLIYKKDIDENDNFIHVEYKNQWFKFNRYDKTLIEKIEECYNTHPYKHCPGLKDYSFHIDEIDDRFTDKKYYKIIKNGKYQQFETLTINKDLIIDDLYSMCHK